MFIFYLISFHYIRSDYVSIDLIRFDLPDFWLGLILLSHVEPPFQCKCRHRNGIDEVQPITCTHESRVLRCLTEKNPHLFVSFVYHLGECYKWGMKNMS